MSIVTQARSVTDALADPRSPHREIARLALPVSAEFVLMLVLGFVNQVFVGSLGATAIAAVGFSNSLTFLLGVTLSCIGSSTTILIARAHGARDHGRLDRTATVAVAVTLVVGVLASLLPWLYSDRILSVMGASPAVAEMGTPYFQLTSLATLAIIMSAVLSGVLRSVGRPVVPMRTTMMTVTGQAVLAYVLIGGVGPFPRLGVAGAGWAMLIATAVKAAVLVVTVFHPTKGVATWRLPRTRPELGGIVTPLSTLAAPLMITQLAFSGGTFLYNVVVQRIGDEQLAAFQIVHTLESVFMMSSIGLMTATTALVGQSLGRGDHDAAQAWVRRVRRAGVGTAAIASVLFAATVLVLPALFPDAGRSVHQMAALGIGVNALFQVIKVRNMIYGAGVLPSSGDVRGVILGDVVGAFVVGLPLAILLGLFTPLGIAGVFLARCVEELTKLAVFTARTRRITWDSLV